MLIPLNPTQVNLLRRALNDAIDDQESYACAWDHLDGKIASEARARVKDYKRFQKVLLKAVRKENLRLAKMEDGER